MSSRLPGVLAPGESPGGSSAVIRRRRSIPPRFATALGVALLLFPSLAHAQPSKLTLEPAPSMPPVVDDRPALTDWLATVHGPGLVEGRLELIVTANSMLLGTVTTEELVFSGDDQKIRILLPPFNWPGAADEVVVNLRLHTKGGVTTLPPQRLRTSLVTARKFPVLLGETKQRPRTLLGRDKLADRLRFEALLPEDYKPRAITVTSHLSAGDFPQDPLTYCHYEVVIVADDVFVALRSPQLEALQHWVRAGGSLYLEPAGILEKSHLDFLNRLAAEDDRNLVFAADDKGRLPASVYFGEAPFLHLRAGLGTAVFGLPQESSPSDDDWWSVNAALWKVRDDRRTELVELQRLSGSGEGQLRASQLFTAADGLNWQGMGGAVGGGGNFLTFLTGPPLTDVTTSLVDALRPQGVRMVPLWVIGGLLTTLVMLIGPVDYLALGWLKRRKWTWITFPVSVLVMTILTIAITNSYLSSAETRRNLVIHDVGRDGELVRSNRIELIFTSASRRILHDVQSALFAPLLSGGRHDPRMPNMPRRYNQNYQTQFLPDVSTVAIQGRVPSRYRVIQDVPQWTPQLNRTFSIRGADSPRQNALKSMPAVAADQAGNMHFDGGATAFKDWIQGEFGPDAEARVVSANGNTSVAALNPGRWNHDGPGFSASARQQLASFALRLTTAPAQGLSAFTSRTSPHGGRSLDDLILHSAGDPNGNWLLIFVPEGEDFVVYRKPIPRR